MEIILNNKDYIKNKIVVSPRYGHFKVVWDICCPDDMAYMVDSKGNVHYFKFIGQNLAGLKEDN